MIAADDPPPRYSDEPDRQRRARSSSNAARFPNRALSGGGSLRLMNAAPANPEHRHHQNRIEMAQNFDPRFFWVKITVTTLVLIGTVVMVVLTDGAQCDEQLRLWLGVYAFLMFGMIVTIATNFYNYRRRRRVNQVHSILSFSFLLWWILGQVWLYRLNSCDTTLWATVLTLVILEYVRICSPCAMLLLLCCCMPCLAPLVDTVSMKGAAKKEIQKLPTKKYEPMADNPEDQCSVCLENFTGGEDVRTLPCGHYFHPHCIDEWLKLNRTCPLCRKDIGGENAPAVPAAENGARAQEVV